MKFIDHMGREIILKEYPERIISLVPSITELLFDLGLDGVIAGGTDYCILPEEEVKKLAKVGGPKKLNFGLIEKLDPDLIIGSKEENNREDIERLRDKYPVWICDVASIKDALKMILDIGELTDKKAEAGSLAAQITSDFQSINISTKIKTAYIIWKEPLMTVGGDTFINDMMNVSGFINVFKDEKRYPQRYFDDLGKADLILLSTEPYLFSEKDVADFKKLLPGKRVLLVDGLIYSWYGSRMKYATSYIKNFHKNFLSNI